MKGFWRQEKSPSKRAVANEKLIQKYFETKSWYYYKIYELILKYAVEDVKLNKNSWRINTLWRMEKYLNAEMSRNRRGSA